MKKEFNKKYAEIALYCLICVILGVVIIFILAGARDFLINKEYSGIFKILQPFIIGAILAYLLNPLMAFLEKKIFSKIIKKKKDGRKNKTAVRTLSLISTLLITFIVIGLLLVMVIPQIMTSINQLTGIVADLFTPVDDDIPEEYVQESKTEADPENTEESGSLFDLSSGDDEINQIEIDTYMISNTKIGMMINDFSYKLQDFIDSMGLNLNVEETFNDLVLVFTSNIVSFTRSIVQPLINQTASIIYSTATGVLNIFLAVIIAIYLLNSKETYVAQTKKVLYSILPANFTNKLLDTGHKAHEIVGGFLIGKILDSLIIGVICFICMTLFNINYSMLISVIVFVTNIIPFFGPFIGAIPSIFFLLFVDPWQALWFIVFILILQQIDGNIIGPKILSSTIGLSSIWVIFSILLMNGLFGLFGMFFGVPIFAVIYILFKEFVENRLKRKNLPHETAEYLTAEENGVLPLENIETPPDKSSERGFIDKTDKKIKDFINRRFKNKQSDEDSENKNN